MKLSKEEKDFILKQREEKQTEEERQFRERLDGVKLSHSKFLLSSEESLKRKQKVADEFISNGIPKQLVVIESRARDMWVSEDTKKMLGEHLPKDLTYNEYTLKVWGARISIEGNKVYSFGVTGDHRKVLPKTMAKKILDLQDAKRAKKEREARDKQYCLDAVKHLEETYDPFRIDFEQVAGRYSRAGGYRLPDYWEIKVTFSSGSYIRLKVSCYSDRYELDVMYTHDARYKTERKAYEWMDEFKAQK